MDNAIKQFSIGEPSTIPIAYVQTAFDKGGEVKSTFKYHKVPNEQLWSIQECHPDFDDGFGSVCITIRNKKSEAEAKKEVARLTKLGHSDYYARGGETERDTERDKNIATTILNQLGGQRRLVMFLGAYNFVLEPYGVAFKIKSKGYSKVNYIKIVLTPMDVYDVTYGRIYGTNYSIVSEDKGIYNDMLKDSIESNTNMYLTFAKGGKTQGGGKKEEEKKVKPYLGEPEWNENKCMKKKAKGGILDLNDEVEWNHSTMDERADLLSNRKLNKNFAQFRYKNLPSKIQREIHTLLMACGGDIEEDYATGGKIEIASIHKINGIDYLFTEPVQNSKGFYDRWKAYKVVYEVKEGDKHINYGLTNRPNNVQFFPNDITKEEADHYF